MLCILRLAGCSTSGYVLKAPISTFQPLWSCEGPPLCQEGLLVLLLYGLCGDVYA